MNTNNNQIPNTNNNQTGQVPNMQPQNPNVINNQNSGMQPLNMVNPATVQPQMPQPQVTSTPVNNITPTPMPANNVAITPTPMPTDPNASIPPVNVVGGMPVMDNKEVVINTTKKKTSYIGLFIVVILLVAFVLNVDTILEYYDEFIQSGSLTSNKKSSDNLSDGYILIGETTSSKKDNDIMFNNFQKSNDNTIIFNYTAFENKTNVSQLNIYIGIYDAEKNLLYRELFNTENDIEKNSTLQYTIKVNDKIYAAASYVKVVSNISSTSLTLTCKKTDNNFNYVNTYNFNNESLISYEVSKESLVNQEVLLNEYNLIKDTKNATLENNVLKYSVDLSTNDTEEFHKGESNYFVKSNLESLEWECK